MNQWLTSKKIIYLWITSSLQCLFQMSFYNTLYNSYRVLTKHYQHVLAFIFAVKDINENLQVLPNITLGFKIHDKYSGKWTYHTIMELFSPVNRLIPNYKCGTKNNLISVIGALYPEISLDMSHILEMYKVPQVGYFHELWNVNITYVLQVYFIKFIFKNTEVSIDIFFGIIFQ